MTRKKRAPEVINALGELGAVATDFSWFASSDPDFMKTEVPNDTALPTDDSVVALMRDFPSSGVTTWYSPTQSAIVAGRVQAAVDTLSATGAQLTTAGENIIGAISGIAANIVPILIGLAALFIFLEKGKR